MIRRLIKALKVSNCVSYEEVLTRPLKELKLQPCLMSKSRPLVKELVIAVFIWLKV